MPDNLKLSSDALQSVFSPLQVQRTDTSTEIGKDAGFRTHIRTQIQHIQSRRNQNRQSDAGPVAIYEDPRHGSDEPSQELRSERGMLRPQKSLRSSAKVDKATEEPDPTKPRRPNFAALDHGSRGCLYGKFTSDASQLFPSQAIPIQRAEPTLCKEPRRRTIYIPSEDTTVLTIHPGRYNERAQDTLMPYATQATRASRQAVRGDTLSQQRQRPYSATTRRVALQPTVAPPQEDAFLRDRQGSGPGKENLPPGYGLLLEKCHQSKGDMHGAKTRYKAPTVRQIPTMAAPRKTKAQNFDGNGQNTSLYAFTLHGRGTNNNHHNHSHLRSEMSNANRQPSKYGEMPKQNASRPETSSANRYPLLPENLHRPEMYDYYWQEYQESAIKQLVNQYFQTTGPGGSLLDSTISHDEARKDMLKQYLGDKSLLLHNRLHAALQFGVLKEPREATHRALKVQKDMGLRRRFISLWLDTYDALRLAAALEVVTGRELDIGIITTRSHAGLHDKRKMREKLTSFIIACLLDDEGIQSDAPGGQSTLLKSLMLAHLLDASKDLSFQPSNLFLRSSKFKSSREVVVELGGLLLPSVGDITRSLAHLDYHVSQKQLPLDEYTYAVSNMAVDLRDGVRLARLVELLLSSDQERDNKSSSLLFASQRQGISHTPQHGPLTQQLSFPAIGRAQKLHNVGMALDAFTASGLDHGQLLANIRAHDIVDGHQEKTLMLMWIMLSRKGLDCLINLRDVRSEISRIQKDTRYSTETVCEAGSTGAESKEKVIAALKAWTRTIARLNGLTVTNWTTCFADGMILSTIVDHYAQYIPSSTVASFSAHPCKPRLDLKLQAIGCSKSFGKAYSSPYVGIVLT